MVDAEARTSATNHEGSACRTHGEDTNPIVDNNPMLAEALFQCAADVVPATVEDNGFLREIHRHYAEDKLFSLILAKPRDFRDFSLKDGLIRRLNLKGDSVVCIPRNRGLISKIITQAHETLGHFGDQRTAKYIRRWYWWPRLQSEVTEFCRTCEACQ
jgi:hypothetical protein